MSPSSPHTTTTKLLLTLVVAVPCSGHGHTPVNSNHHNQKSYSSPCRRMCQCCSGLGYGAITNTYSHHKLLLMLAEDVPMLFRPWLLHTMTTNMATPHYHHTRQPQSYSSPWQRLCQCCSRWLQLHHQHIPRPQSYSSPWQRLC